MKSIITTIFGLYVILNMEVRSTYSQSKPINVSVVPVDRPLPASKLDGVINSEIDSLMKSINELKEVSNTNQIVTKRGKRLVKTLDSNYERIQKLHLASIPHAEVKPLQINLGPIQPIRSIKLTIDSSKAVNLPSICTKIPKKKNIFKRIFN